MKLDATVMRTMSRQDYRVLEATEAGMQTRSLVPAQIIASTANLRYGGCHKIISNLHRDNLLAHDQSCGYDGYRLTTSGFDILALWHLKQRGVIAALGDQIGVGKESDVYIAASPEGKQLVLKFHRLGRTSFRDVKKKRDYFQINTVKSGKTGKYGTVYSHKDQPNSWLFLSRISALKEYTFMKALYDVGYPTPKPIAHSRHVCAMGLIRGSPLYQIHRNRVTADQAESIFAQAMDICKQLARNGLVHCDLNEFNLIVDLSGGAQSAADADGDGEDAGEFYVRHSGSNATVATYTKGQLTVPYGERRNGKLVDGTGEVVTEAPPEPREYLENGVDAKPIVTLIDFPQMVSVRHPNAEELWRRDIECLKRFFTMKLRINFNEEDWEKLIPVWDELIANVDENEVHFEDEDYDNEEKDGEKSVLSISSNSCLASKKQLRLDKELQASGFSKEDAARKNELSYYESLSTMRCDVVQEEDDLNSDDDNGLDEDNKEADDYDGEISDKEDDEIEEQEVHVYHPQNDDFSVGNFSTMSRAESYAIAESKARERVRKHLIEMKKSKSRQENKHHAVYDYNTIVIMRRLIVVSVYLVKALHAYTCPYFSPVGIKASISPLLYMSESSPDDNSFVDYSSSLTPRQEWDQINSELGFAQDRNWKRFLKRPLKIIGKSISKLVESEKKTGTLILVRCGESEYSGNYTFTGWLDADLTKNGQSMMRHAGRLLLASGYEPDIIYTSRLKRAIKSAWAIVQEISTPFLPVYKSWRLNERHYGSLQGLSKTETAKRLGKEVVQAWRRSLKSRPPLLKISDPQYPGHDKKYADLFPEQIPRGESLLDCMRRTKPLWEFIKKDIKGGKSVLIVAHAASLRGIAKIIDDIDDEQISEVSFPKGIPVVYKFDKSMLPIKPEGKDALLLNTSTSGYFLENPELLQKALKITKEWEEDVPGSQGRNLNILKRMNTVEQSLLQLRSEQEEWPIDERFEIEMSVSPKQEVVKANVNIFSNPKDPVVVLVRHGRTPHNQLGLFTGWEDPALAPEGEEDARNAGRLLKKYGFEFDVVYSSWLYRAIQTAWFILEEMDMLWLPMIKSWRLNERHYGALTGLSKKMVENIHGERQLKNWRRGYTTRPPAISSYSPNYPGNDRRRVKYVKDLRISVVETICRSIEDRKLSLHRKFPKCESLKDCMDRSIPFYTQKIVPEAVSKGKRVLITSHENAIRGILMHLCEIPEEHMNDLHLPNGIPLVYSVKRKCITLLDDGSEENLLEKYDFGSAAQFLFRPCEIEEDEDWFIPSSLRE